MSTDGSRTQATREYYEANKEKIRATRLKRSRLHPETPAQREKRLAYGKAYQQGLRATETPAEAGVRLAKAREGKARRRARLEGEVSSLEQLDSLLLAEGEAEKALDEALRDVDQAESARENAYKRRGKCRGAHDEAQAAVTAFIRKRSRELAGAK